MSPLPVKYSPMGTMRTITKIGKSILYGEALIFDSSCGVTYSTGVLCFIGPILIFKNITLKTMAKVMSE